MTGGLETDRGKRVSDLLDVVEAAARALTDTDGDDARRRVSAGLQDLHVHLLEHLDYEERNAGPAMRRLDHLHYQLVGTGNDREG